MPSPSVEIQQLLMVFAVAFTTPTYNKGLQLLLGAILAPGRRTIAAILRVMGLSQDGRFSNYYRVLNRARWDALLVSRILLGLIVSWCIPAGLPIIILVDETLERRWGAKIKYKGFFRDAIRSTKKKVAYSPGIRWLCMAVVVPVPWSRRWWALPFLTVPLLSPKTSIKLKRRHRTTVQRTANMISLVRRWFPDREIVVVGDGGFAAVPLIQHCQRKHIKVTLISRLRLDARLFNEPSPQPKSKPGPKPKKGARQPSLKKQLEDKGRQWTTMEIDWYGGKKRSIEFMTGTQRKHRKGLNPVPIRWLLIRDPEGKFKPMAFFCSAQNVSARQMIEWFILRWNIEVTFEEVRAHLGFGTQRQWSDQAIERTTPCILGVFSIVVLVAMKLHPQKLPRYTTSWYKKEEATFSDALSAVRRHILNLDKYPTSSDFADSILIPRSLFQILGLIAQHPF